MNTDLPIVAALNPAQAPAPENGAAVIDSRIESGLPHVIALGGRFRAVLNLPTGTAQAWLNAAPQELVQNGAPRLRVQRDARTIAVLPLVAGAALEVADATGAVPLTVQVIDAALHAGTVRGAGAFGSFVRLAVRVADRASNSFGPLPPSDFVIRLLPKADAMESRGGVTVAPRYKRLLLLREAVKWI